MIQVSKIFKRLERMTCKSVDESKRGLFDEYFDNMGFKTQCFTERVKMIWKQ